MVFLAGNCAQDGAYPLNMNRLAPKRASHNVYTALRSLQERQGKLARRDGMVHT